MDRRHFLAGTGAMTVADAIGLGTAVAQDAAGETRAPAPRASIERELAEYGAALTYDKLPREVVAAAKRLLIDALACGYGAIGSSAARIVEATFRQSFGGPAVASVLGSAARISTEGAALVNGVLVRDLDLNDTHVGKEPCHPSENIPAALACCEEAGRSGSELIETIVLGYEAQLAFNSAFAFGERGLFSVSAAGFVVPLMAGKAWRLPVAQVVEAIGISGVRQLTLLAITRGPISMMKALPYAHNAMDGLFATRLAAAGFTGAGNAMDWFLKEVKPAEPDLRLDLRKFRIGEVGLKRFPLQFELQTIAEAGVNLHAKARERIGEIAQIVVETYPITIERTASPSRYDPKTRETADHSLPVCLAMALLDGEVTIAQYEKERWRAGDVLGLARKVAVKVGERLAQSAPRGSGAIVKLVFADGTSVEETVPIADGDARRPMSRAALEQKFKSLAVPTLGEAGAARVLGLVERLETLSDLRELTAALRGA
jgi:2-methylcitrate dehydratase